MVLGVYNVIYIYIYPVIMENQMEKNKQIKWKLEL